MKHNQNISISKLEKKCEYCEKIIKSKCKYNLARSYKLHILKEHSREVFCKKMDSLFEENMDLFCEYAQTLLHKKSIMNIMNTQVQDEPIEISVDMADSNSICSEELTNETILSPRENSTTEPKEIKRTPSSHQLNKELNDDDVEELSEILEDRDAPTFLLNAIFILHKERKVLYCDVKRRNVSYSEYENFCNELFTSSMKSDILRKVNNKIHKFFNEFAKTDNRLGLRSIIRKRRGFEVVFEDDKKVITQNIFKSLSDKQSQSISVEG